ncbi:MAG: hypothetical protein ACTSWH_05995 [Promethearchaeota archaeon]
MNLKMFKLTTGDVILGEISDNELTDVITINKPLQLVMDPTQGGVGLMPYNAIFAQKEVESVEIKSEHIVHEIEVAKAFEDSYIQFKTGIEVAQ